MDEKNHAIAAAHEHEPAEFEIRCSKVTKLRELGIDPWPEFKPVTITTIEALKKGMEHAAAEETTESYALAGRLMSRREHGKTIFGHIQDRTGRIQIYLRKDVVGDAQFDLMSHLIDIGDIIWVKGHIFTTKMGEVTIRVSEFTLLSKCLFPLPEKFHGLTDVEQRYRQRYLDLMVNHESREKFVKRSQILFAIRKYLIDRDFLEVETPMLHPIPGGAVARPFVTHHNAYDMELFLRIAPELYLKRLVIGGFERVFEINRNFRNEGISTRHNPEFTMLEFYMAHGNYEDSMAMTEELIRYALAAVGAPLHLPFGEHVLNFERHFARYTMAEALCHLAGFTFEQLEPKNIDAQLRSHAVEIPNKNASYGEKLFALFEECAEEKIVQPTFIIGYPIEVSPLSKKDPHNLAFAARFELFIAGMEIANSFTELNDPFDQEERFKKQAEARSGGDIEAHHFDADFVKALQYGMPPAVGVGLGIDRLVMLLTNTAAIKDVILFPTLKRIHE